MREKDKKRGEGERQKEGGRERARLLVSYMSEYAVITTVCDWYGNSTA